LSISPEGRAFLREKPALSLRVLKKARRDRKSRDRQTTPAFPAADRDLFEKLRAKRLELAKAQSVPPYVIFHDKTLAEMAARRPRSVAEFATIPGAGQVKLARYGEAFLMVINDHEVRAGETLPRDNNVLPAGWSLIAARPFLQSEAKSCRQRALFQRQKQLRDHLTLRHLRKRAQPLATDREVACVLAAGRQAVAM
jgi:ribonuclease D